MMGKLLLAVGSVLALVGAFLFVGNTTGLFPTLPFAGGLTGALGMTLASVGSALIRGEKLTVEIEKRPTSPVIVVLALLLFLPLLVGSIMLLGSNLENETSGARWVGSTLFFLISAGLVFALVAELVRQVRARGR